MAEPTNEQPKPGEEKQPQAIIQEFWRQRNEWANASRQRKKWQELARGSALILATVGTALSTGASQMSQTADENGGWGFGKMLGIGGAVLVGVAAYLAKEFLAENSDEKWVRCRTMAEALKREAWLAAMGVPPYDGANMGKLLEEKAVTYHTNLGLESVNPIDDPNAGSMPKASTVEDYIQNRVEDQIDWYCGRIQKARRKAILWRVATLALGVTATVFGIVGAAGPPAFSGWVPVIGMMIATITAHVQASRLNSQIAIYQWTLVQLRLKVARFNRERTPVSELVAACEEIMARENTAWQADWLNPEKARAAVKQINEALKPITKENP